MKSCHKAIERCLRRLRRVLKPHELLIIRNVKKHKCRNKIYITVCNVIILYSLKLLFLFWWVSYRWLCFSLLFFHFFLPIQLPFWSTSARVSWCQFLAGRPRFLFSIRIHSLATSCRPFPSSERTTTIACLRLIYNNFFYLYDIVRIV